MGTGGLKQLQDHLLCCKTLQLCGNRLGSSGASLLWNALHDNTTLEELYLDLTDLMDRGLHNILDSLSGNTTLRLLSIPGNRFSPGGQHILSELHRRNPKLKIVSCFLSDAALLQSYLDWVDEITVEPKQMESVNNAGVLDMILETLVGTDNPEASQEAQEKRRAEEKDLCYPERGQKKEEEKRYKPYLI
ncbi:NACHT LRR and PYD domains-containing protein 12-like [Crotalus adamanteus]|uniref:NACHT LRR and PYD domains-containing protein 12-like n=1 Tax=Crotalus adamanteus TaxID=8729 RepID=A0AAW1AX41_CROAD